MYVMLCYVMLYYVKIQEKYKCAKQAPPSPVR
jgi:hypothetical protein